MNNQMDYTDNQEQKQFNTNLEAAEYLLNKVNLIVKNYEWLKTTKSASLKDSKKIANLARSLATLIDIDSGNPKANEFLNNQEVK